MRRYALILLAVAAAVAGVVVLSFFRQPTLGLDLQGGMSVVLEAEAPPGEEVDQEGLDRSIEIMRERVDKIGVAEPEIRAQGDNQIAIEMPGVHDAARAAEIVGQTAQLEFYDLEGNLTGGSIDAQGFPVAHDSLAGLLSGQQRAAREGRPAAWYLFDRGSELLAGPAETRAALLEEIEAERAPEGAEFRAVPEGMTVITCGEGAVVCPGAQNDVPPSRTYYYLFKHQPAHPENPIPEMTGSDLQLTGTRQDFDPQTGQPIVTLEFTDAGGRRFHEITRELAQRGRTKAQLLNIEKEAAVQHFAIVLDEEIRSWPSIDYVENPDGIAGTRAQITGLDSIEEARNLALVLQTGALPYDFLQVERTDISPTLGEDSLVQALWAGIGGLVAVALFLLLVYRFLGLVAIAGLGIYGVLLYGAILAFNVTLTLPGIAGLILTLGVAADANVVIFERIKEEVRAGKSMRAAVAGGYRKGFRTIVDGNVVTMITAAVLFMVATGGVRGFALMLLIGTLISMVTAVVATRALLGLLGGIRWLENPRLMGATAQKIPAWQRIDFIGKRRVWFALSGTIIAVGLGSLALQGLNLGIDFRGGSQVSFETTEPVPVEQVRAEAASIGRADAIIQGRGERVGNGYTAFQLKTAPLSASEQTDLQRALEREVGATAVGVKNVSASFSAQILKSALLAIAVSLVLIVVYVSVRFEFKFALPVIAALFHDLLIAIGIYSLTGREMTTATVAALLTILGYSIYDTVIIFDRVRENIPLMRRSSFAAITNQSLWEVVRRSIATSVSTLLPVTSLLVFGGDTLKDFAFALLVGVTAGAYSSIFVAAPILAILKEREPEYAKRKAAGHLEKVELQEEPAARPAPEPVLTMAAGGAVPEAEEREGDGAAALARREARRKRRRSRPHGRAR